MDWRKALHGCGAAGAAAAHHGWIALVIVLGPLVVICVTCIAMVLCVSKDRRHEAIASLAPVLTAAVAWSSKRHGGASAKAAEEAGKGEAKPPGP